MELLIRPARTDDLKEIWDLLHANTVVWDDARIVTELSRLWVMLQDAKMLGVLYGNFETGEKRIEWVAIHPLYTEEQLRETMASGVCGMLKLLESTEKRLLGKCKLILGLSS